METPWGEIPDRLAKDMTGQEMHEYVRARYSRRGLLRAGLAAGAAAAAGPLFFRAPRGHADFIGPSSLRAITPGSGIGPSRLAYGTDPTTQFVVAFSGTSTTVLTNPQVEWGPDTNYGVTTPADGSSVRSSVTTPIYYRATLSGLTPGTTYHYRIKHAGGTTADATFTTAPVDRGPFRFTAFGDEAVSSSAVAVMNRVIGAQPVFHLHAGDLSYAGGSSSTWDSYLAQIEPLSSTVPWMISYGNHELEGGFDFHGYSGVQARFPNTLNGIYYSFEYRNVGVIALDSNEQSYEYTNNYNWTGGAQTAWLQSKLAQYRAPGSGIDFVVVHFHFCPYCTNTTHPSDLRTRTAWSGLFDTYGVDVVLNGHNHCYERTYPIKNNTIMGVVPNNGVVNDSNRGPVYVCTGGAGQSLYTGFYAAGAAKVRNASGTSANDTLQNYTAFRQATYQFMTVDVTPAPITGGTASMKLQSINSTGTVIDTFTVERSVVAPPPAEVPEFPTPVLAAVGGAAILGAAALIGARSA